MDPAAEVGQSEDHLCRQGFWGFRGNSQVQRDLGGFEVFRMLVEDDPDSLRGSDLRTEPDHQFGPGNRNVETAADGPGIDTEVDQGMIGADQV